MGRVTVAVYLLRRGLWCGWVGMGREACVRHQWVVLGRLVIVIWMGVVAEHPFFSGLQGRTWPTHHQKEHNRPDGGVTVAVYLLRRGSWCGWVGMGVCGWHQWVVLGRLVIVNWMDVVAASILCGTSRAAVTDDVGVTVAVYLLWRGLWCGKVKVGRDACVWVWQLEESETYLSWIHCNLSKMLCSVSKAAGPQPGLSQKIAWWVNTISPQAVQINGKQKLLLLLLLLLLLCYCCYYPLLYYLWHYYYFYLLHFYLLLLLGIFIIVTFAIIFGLLVFIYIFVYLQFDVTYL